MNRAKRDKKKAVLKRGEHTYLLPKEIKTTPQIICMTCGEPSGWTNDDLRFITKSRNLKCTVCKETCAIIKINDEDDDEEQKRIFVDYKENSPMKQRNYDNLYS